MAWSMIGELLKHKDSLEILEVMQIGGDSLAQAIIEDFIIFDLVPKAMKYGTEISIELLKQTPKMVTAITEGTARNIEATGTLAERTGKGIKAAEGILGGI